MAKFYFDDDADLSILKRMKVGMLGYGNQGRSQALNLRDSGVELLLGNIEDSYAEQARADGFTPRPMSEVVAAADILMILIPDEVQPEVYQEYIRPSLREGQVLSWAHGYNVYFKFIEPPPFVDVVMLAPRMIGRGVRETYVRGIGFPSLVCVHQDYSGEALARVLALSKGIGSTKMGVLMSSFEEETVVDLFAEHSPGVYGLRAEYDALVESGCSPESIILDLYASGECVEWAQGAVDLGAFERMRLASHTAQFGGLVWAERWFNAEGARQHAREVIQHIKNGDFAQEWHAEQEAGLPRLKRVWQMQKEHPMEIEEDKLYQFLGRRPKSAKTDK